MKTFYPDIEETIHEKTLENGLKLVIIPKKGFAKTEVELAVSFGSLDVLCESADDQNHIQWPLGIAHFIEHLLFESEDSNSTEAFARVGASVNAYTSYDKTNYYFSTTNDSKSAIALLLIMVFEPHFTEKNVIKEAKIINQEIKMYEDDFQQQIYNDLMNHLYLNHPIRYDIAGTVESVNQTDFDTLVRAYQHYYHPANMMMVIIGDVEVESLILTIESELKNYVIKPWKLKSRLINQDQKNHHSFKKTITKDISMPMVITGLKVQVQNNESPLKIALDEIKLSFLLSGVYGKSGKYYHQLMKKHLINDSFEFFSNLESTYGHIVLFTETKKNNQTEMVLKDQIKSLIDNPPDQKLFELSKRKMIGEFLVLCNSISQLGNYAMDYFIKGINPFEFYHALCKMTYDEMQLIRNRLIIDTLVTIEYIPAR